MAIELDPDTRKRAITSLRKYLSEELEEEIGDLKAQLFLDFFLKEIGPSIHNAALERSQAYLRDRLLDLDGVCSEVEFGYWLKIPKREGNPRSGGGSRK